MNRGTLRLLTLPAGLLIWSSSFVLLYAAASIGCRLGWQDLAIGPVPVLRLVLMAITGLHLAAIAWVGRVLARSAASADDETFLRNTAWGVLVAGAVATVWTALPVLAASCGL